MICPYCNKREIKNKGKTCGDKECINKARKKSTLNTLHKKYGENGEVIQELIYKNGVRVK